MRGLKICTRFEKGMGCALSAAKDEMGEETIPLEAMPTESDHTSSEEKSNNEKGLRRVVNYLKKNWRNLLACVFLWLAYFISSAAFSMMAPFFPEEVEERKGYSSAITGLILSCSPLCVVIFSPVFGYFLPRIGFRIMIAAGLLAIGSSYLLLGFVDLLPANWVFVVVCILLRIVEGIGTALLFTVTFTVLPILFPNSVATLMGLFEMSAGVGYAMGPPLGGLLYQYGGFKTPFITVGVSVFIFILPCTLLIKGKSETKKHRPMFKVFLKSFTDFAFILLALSSVLGLAAFTFSTPTLQHFLSKQFNLNSVQVGLVFFIAPFFYLISALIVGPVSDALGPRWFIVIGFLVCGASLIFLGPAEFISAPRLWITCVALIFFGIGIGVGNVPIFGDMLAISKRELETDDENDVLALTSLVSGLLAATISLGQFLGPLVGGALTEVLSFPTTALLVAEILMAETILLLGVTVIEKYASQGSDSPS